MNVVRLRSGDGRLEAAYLRAAGMRCASLRLHGVELLAREHGIADPVLSSAMAGIPLLHPWANRLARDSYTAAGRTGRLPQGTSLVPRDGRGLAIHGLVAAPDAWRVVTHDRSALRAELEFPTDDLRAAAFPFAHRLVLDAALDTGGLRVRVALEPLADVPVPVAFGFHPYLRPPGSRRSQWRVTLPARARVETDGDGLPTGRLDALDASTGGLPDATVDEAYVDLPAGSELGLADDDLRLTLTLEAGFPAAQLYSPSGADFLCLEPVTAPPNALATGDRLTWVAPGERYEAAFRLAVS